MNDLSHGNPNLYEDDWFIEPIMMKDIGPYPQDPIDCRAKFEQLHGSFGTHVPVDSQLILGNGSTELMINCLHLLSKKLNSRKIYVKTPCYMYFYQYLLREYELVGEQEAAIKIVTNPNNPDGSYDSELPSTEQQFVIVDRAYHWPQYGAPMNPISDHPRVITLYTLSKFCGVGGCRVGWGWSNINLDYDSYYLLHNLTLNGLAVYTINNLLVRLTAMVSCNWRKWKEIIEERRRAVMELFVVVNESGPYAWLYSRGNDMVEVARAKGVIVKSGVLFGVSEEFARLSLIASTSV